jgi:uncharacterized membrane protein
VIGGPLGAHSVRPGGNAKFWNPVRVVLAMVCLTLSLHWVQKVPCSDGNWDNLEQFKYFCYTDVLALYYSDGLAEGQMPYRDHLVEYPVLTGAVMGLIGLPVHGLAGLDDDLNDGALFYHLNAVALGALAVATAGMLLAMRRRRPWDIAMFALSPALLLSATINWDLLSIALAAGGLYLWSRRHPAWAGVLIGLGAAAKLWPVFLLVALMPLCLRAGRMRAFWTATGTATASWVVVNAPVALFWRDGWWEFFRLNQERQIDWGTLWYIGDHFPRGQGQYGLAWFNQLNAAVPRLNLITYILIIAAWFAIGTMVVQAPRRPRLAQVAFLVVAAFLIFNKVWSQQFVLWLLPLAVLARPRWGAFIAWQAAEVCYFAAFYGQMMNAFGRFIFPEGIFVLASTVRIIGVCVFAGFIIRDIMRPENDVVRRTYDDDPDGGVLDGSPDGAWALSRL